MIALLAAGLAHGAETGSFADHLARRGDFDAAVLEYRRDLFGLKDPAARPPIARKLLTASVLTRRYDAAAKLAQDLRDDYPGDASLGCVSSAFRGRAAYGARNLRLAGQTLEEAAKCPEPERSYGSYWSGLSLLRQGSVADAKARLGAVGPGSDKAEPARKLLSLPDAAFRLPRRSPALAGTFNALLPGAGYAYADSPATAFAALATNALFIWATYRAASYGDAGSASVLGLISFGWYFGGVYGGAAAAERFNRRAADRFFAPYELD